MLSLDRPALDWVQMAQSMGVAAVRVTDCDGLENALADGLTSNGPALIEVAL
ncbi:MAG: thiamine pyrophosphate-dependent enzyme [Pikeienuella sp.]